MICEARETNVPDLKGRFIVGVGSQGDYSYNLNDKGGQAKHTLTISQMPRHNHYKGEYKFILKKNGHVTAPNDVNDSRLEPNLGNCEPLQPSGNNEPFDIRPPYYALNYTMGRNRALAIPLRIC